jgi:hypothetical protein
VVVVGFEQYYRIRAGRIESGEKSLNVWNLRPLAIAMAEIVKI